MTDYKGFKYEKVPGGWRLLLPTGTKLRTPEQTEENIKKLIDSFIAEKN